MYCRICATHNDDDAVYCTECGAPLAPQNPRPTSGETAVAARKPVKPEQLGPVPMARPASRWMNKREWLQRLSGLTGLKYYEQHRVFGDKSGALIGTLNGYIAAIGFGKLQVRQKCAVFIILRYEQNTDLGSVQESLKAADCGFKIRFMDASMACAIRGYSFAKPQPETAAKALHILLKAVAATAVPLACQCEECKRIEQSIILQNEPGFSRPNAHGGLERPRVMPRHLCPSCQAAIHHAQEAERDKYNRRPCDITRGTLYGVAAGLLGAVLWGMSEHILHRIYAYAAIAVGFGIGKAVSQGAGKINWGTRILTGTLTLGSVILGTLLASAMDVQSLFHTSLSQSLGFVATNIGSVLAGGEVTSVPFDGDAFVTFQTGSWSILFAVIGGVAATRAIRPPSFETTFTPLSL